MEKYFCAILILSALFLQGCSKNDDLTAGRGELRYNGNIYQLKNAYHIVSDTETGGLTFDRVPYSARFHMLEFTGKDGGTRVALPIRSEDIEIAGEFHVGLTTIKYEYNSIQMEINLEDDFVWFTHNHGPAKRKIYISYTNEGDIFEIELKDVDEESDFLVKWKGPLKDTWW